MTALAVPPGSPFEAIKHVDGDGEHWFARELMPLYGYGQKWQNFAACIERAMVGAQTNGEDVGRHFTEISKKTPGRPAQDYRLTRHAAYLIAMEGDPSKPEIAAAKHYFAVRTAQAEAAELAASEDHDLDMLAGMLAALRAQRAEIRAQARRMDLVEAKVAAIEGDYRDFTALGYARLHGHPTGRPFLQRVGRRASAIMRAHGEEPHRRQDATFGTVGVYPVEVLEQAFDEVRPR